MADIFISYSKPDRELVLKLSAFLEAEGWSVWWDRSLEPADKFRDVIMKELAAARAVITIWTEKSITSDWVRAEAGRAKADGKLVPVKTSAVNYADIPLPFGEMHTDDVTATELIRAAVVAQLAKPAVTPSALQISIKTLRYQILTWGGIIGGAITLFTSLGSVLRMADWARWLVTYWHDWMHRIWTWAFSWIGINIHPVLTPVCSFLLFMLMLSVGIRLREIMFAQNRDHNSSHVQRPLIAFLFALIIQPVFVAFITFIDILIFFDPILILGDFIRSLGGETIISFAIIGAIFATPLAIFVIVLSNQKVKAFFSYALCYIFLLMMVALPVLPIIYFDIPPRSYLGFLAFAALLVFLPIMMFALVIFTPLNALAKRLWSVAIGLAFLIMLNELSKFELRF